LFLNSNILIVWDGKLLKDLRMIRGDRMYAMRRWDEEVVKWMAVTMVLAMVGLAVIPSVTTSDLVLEYYSKGEISQAAAVIAAAEGFHAASLLLAMAALGAGPGAVFVWALALVGPILAE